MTVASEKCVAWAGIVKQEILNDEVAWHSIFEMFAALSRETKPFIISSVVAEKSLKDCSVSEEAMSHIQ